MKRRSQFVKKLIELKYLIQYWNKMPKGIRRRIIEMSISLGQLSDCFCKTDMNNKAVDDIFKIFEDSKDSLCNYVGFLKRTQENRRKNK